MVIDFKNKTIQVPRGTSVTTLMDFMKTIIHENMNNFEIVVEKEPVTWITSPVTPCVPPYTLTSTTNSNPYNNVSTAPYAHTYTTSN